MKTYLFIFTMPTVLISLQTSHCGVTAEFNTNLITLLLCRLKAKGKPEAMMGP